MKTFAKIFVAIIVATAMACVLIAHDASDNAVLSVYFFSAIGVCDVLGVFDIPKSAINKSGERTIGGVMRDAA